MKKVFIVNGSHAYKALFMAWGFHQVADIENSDLVCFTGGSDVSPNLYGASQHRSTCTNPHRDKQEIEIFHAALGLDLPMVGICRGGQFLNVMSGGRLYQDVTGHLGNHEIIVQATGETILVTSTHHQMFMPSEKAAIIALADLPSTREWYDGHVALRDHSNTGYEVIRYDHTKCLCFQPHPEMMPHSRMAEFFFEQVRDLMKVTREEVLEGAHGF